jgi:hypothetical protein
MKLLPQCSTLTAEEWVTLKTTAATLAPIF